MGKFVIKIFEIIKWFRLSWLRLTGKTEDDFYVQRIISGKAWAEFCGGGDCQLNVFGT